MTEASHQMTSNPLPKNGSHKAGTVGKAQGSVQIFILDNNNKPLPSGKIGEVCLRGPNVTKGYLNNPTANAEGFAGDILHISFKKQFIIPSNSSNLMEFNRHSLAGKRVFSTNVAQNIIEIF